MAALLQRHRRAAHGGAARCLWLRPRVSSLEPPPPPPLVREVNIDGSFFHDCGRGRRLVSAPGPSRRRSPASSSTCRRRSRWTAMGLPVAGTAVRARRAYPGTPDEFAPDVPVPRGRRALEGEDWRYPGGIRFQTLDLLWQFENVLLHLRVLATDRPEGPAGRAQSLQVARAVQSFLEMFSSATCGRRPRGWRCRRPRNIRFFSECRFACPTRS